MYTFKWSVARSFGRILGQVHLKTGPTSYRRIWCDGDDISLVYGLCIPVDPSRLSPQGAEV